MTLSVRGHDSDHVSSPSFADCKPLPCLGLSIQNGPAMLVALLHHSLYHHRLLLLQISVGTPLISKSSVQVVVVAVIIATVWFVPEQFVEGATDIRRTAPTWP
jgi:hypothetical protein